MRLFVLCRHGQSTLNLENRINGDPAVPAPLTEAGRAQAELLRIEIAQLPFDRCVHTRFERSRETARLVLAGRDVPLDCEPLLDDIEIGELEGQTIDDYRAWKRQHTRADAFPGGESLDDAAARYAQAFERLLAHDARATLVVCHEIPVRYAVNAAAGSSDLDAPVHAIPNAAPFLFDEDSLAGAAAQIRRLLREVRARGIEPPRDSRPTGT
jgi:broad specificity phosphatase PhoE